MTKKAVVDFTHAPLFTLPIAKSKLGRPRGVWLTEAGAAVLLYLRAQSSTTIREIAEQMGAPPATLRKVLRVGDGMNAARMEQLLRLVSPKQSAEKCEALPSHLLEELVRGAGAGSVATEIEQKRIWKGASPEPIPVHVQLDQLDVVANFLNPKTTVIELREWLAALTPGGEQASDYVLSWAARNTEPILVVRPNKLSSVGRVFTDIPYRAVFDVVAYEPHQHPKEPLLARVGIGRVALCRRHQFLNRQGKTFQIPTCVGCAIKSRTKPQLFIRIEGRGFASGRAAEIVRCFFTPFARPGFIWVSKYHLALDVERAMTDVIAVIKRGPKQVVKVTARVDSGIETSSVTTTQPNEGMVTGLYFGATPSPIVVYDKSERLALGHGARPRWLVKRDAARRLRGGLGFDDIKFTRVELRVRPLDGKPVGVVARDAPALLSRVLVADRSALYADGLRGLLLDCLAFEGLVGHDAVTRARFDLRPDPEGGGDEALLETRGERNRRAVEDRHAKVAPHGEGRGDRGGGHQGGCGGHCERGRPRPRRRSASRAAEPSG